MLRQKMAMDGPPQPAQKSVGRSEKVDLKLVEGPKREIVLTAPAFGGLAGLDVADKAVKDSVPGSVAGGVLLLTFDDAARAAECDGEGLVKPI